jgi:hypothetical protein
MGPLPHAILPYFLLLFKRKGKALSLIRGKAKHFLLRLHRVPSSFFDRNTDEIRKAIIGANDAIASVRAKPKMA